MLENKPAKGYNVAPDEYDQIKEAFIRDNKKAAEIAMDFGRSISTVRKIEKSKDYKEFKGMTTIQKEQVKTNPEVRVGDEVVFHLSPLISTCLKGKVIGVNRNKCAIQYPLSSFKKNWWRKTTKIIEPLIAAVPLDEVIVIQGIEEEENES